MSDAPAPTVTSADDLPVDSSPPLQGEITRARMVGINSFVVVTEPLGAEGEKILPGGQSAADSRFVVRYWRKTTDGRLVFGGGESNSGSIPADVRSFVRPHLLEERKRIGSFGHEPLITDRRANQWLARRDAWKGYVKVRRQILKPIPA